MRMHLGAQHFRDDDSSRSARRLLFNRARCLILFLFLSSLVLLERARRASPPCFLKEARPRASHDRDTTPLHRTFGEANLEALRMRVTHVTRGKRQTRGKVQGCCVHPCFTAPLVRSLLAPEQPYNNNGTFDKHRDMTARWPLT